MVLSGGGARGVAHLGVLKGLNELGLRPSVISGVSAEAIVAALYSAGYAPADILRHAQEHAFSLVNGFVLLNGGLFSSAGLRRFLQTYLPNDTFESLRIPILVTATDIISGKSITISEGVLSDVLIGSAAVPGIFSPVEYKTYSLVDGGILNNFPIECISKTCDKIIGCHVNKLEDFQPSSRFSRLHIIERAFQLTVYNTVRNKSKMCDVFLEPSLESFTMFDMKHAEKIFELGYQATIEKRDTFLSW